MRIRKRSRIMEDIVVQKILLVDDAGILLRTVKGMLDEFYDVKVVISGRLAVNSIKIDRPDLVILDYGMPSMDGESTFDAIRALDNGRDIPIIYLTGADDKITIMKLMKKKPAGYILKPPEKEKLLKTVRDVLEKAEKEKGNGE